MNLSRRNFLKTLAAGATAVAAGLKLPEVVQATPLKQLPILNRWSKAHIEAAAGIAGERLWVGDLVKQRADGKFYRTTFHNNDFVGVVMHHVDVGEAVVLLVSGEVYPVAPLGRIDN